MKGSDNITIAFDGVGWLGFNAVMARPIRVEYAGAVYHIMDRGNQGQKVPVDDGGRKMWTATVND